MKLDKVSNEKSKEKSKEKVIENYNSGDNFQLQMWMVFVIIGIVILYIMWKYEFNGSTSNMLRHMILKRGNFD